MLKKKRELTLKQLEERLKICDFIGNVLMIICPLYGLFLVIISTIKDLYIIIFAVLFIAMMLSFKISDKIIVCIAKKKKQIRISTIKELAKDGELKESVSIIDKEIILNILSKNIKKITIDDNGGSNFVTSIQLGNAKIQSKVYIPAEKLISILDENSKKEMLEHLVENIKIGNLEGTTEVEIVAANFLYTNLQTTDAELLQIFDLKEE